MTDTTSNRATAHSPESGSASVFERIAGVNPAVILAFVVGVVLVLVTVETIRLGSFIYDLTSDNYPGLSSTILMIGVRTVAFTSAALAVGGLAVVCFCTDSLQDGRLGIDGYRLCCLAGRASGIWCIAALVMVPITAADTSGMSVWRAWTLGALPEQYSKYEYPKAWLCAAVLAFVVWLFSRLFYAWIGALMALVFAAVGAMAPAFTGNNGQGKDHDYGTNALILYSLGAALLVGGIFAYLFLRRDSIDRPRIVFARIRNLLVVALILVWTGGLLSASIQILPGDWASSFGRLTFTQLAGGLGITLGLAILMWWPRRIYSLGLRVVGVLLVAGGLVISGAAVVLSNRMPSAMLQHMIDGTLPVTPMEVYVGYNVSLPVTLRSVLSTWRPDAVWLIIASVAVGLYLILVRRMLSNGGTWLVSRTICWCFGWFIIVFLTSSGVAVYGGVVFSMHMVLHLVLNLAVPAFLVSAGPLSLVLQAYPAVTDGQGTGPHEWARFIVSSPFVRSLTNPVVALTIYVATLVILYFTPLFDPVIRYHWGHQWMNLHFILTGCLFFWPICGVDPGPRKLPVMGRIGMLLAIMPFHAAYGVIVMTMNTLLGASLYTALWVYDEPELFADQRLGGMLAWISGEVPLLIAVAVVLIQWLRRERRQADSPRDRTFFDELAAERKNDRRFYR